MIFHLIALEALVFLILAIMALLWRNFNRLISEQKKQREAIESAIVDMLHDNLIERSEKYLERGYLSKHGWETFDSKYHSYKKLDGNGLIDKLYKEVKMLPFREKEREVSPW